MKTCLTTLCALLLAVAASQAAEPLHVKLFPEGTPTKSGLEEQPEGVNDKGYYIRVSDPELLVYLPDSARATGQAMLVVRAEVTRKSASHTKVTRPPSGSTNTASPQ